MSIEDLESLGGGGDTKSEHLRLIAVITPPSSIESFQKNSKSHDSILSDRDRINTILLNYNTSIGLRDILATPLTSTSQSIRYFPVTKSITKDKKDEVVQEEIAKITADILGGFNHNLITFGETKSEKTKTLFDSQEGGVVIELLTSIFKKKHLSDIVAVSCWTVQGKLVTE